MVFLSLKFAIIIMPGTRKFREYVVWQEAVVYATWMSLYSRNFKKS